MGAPVITYQRDYRFDLAPDRLWDSIEEVDQFERWWPWLTEFRLEGDGLSAGSVLHGVVTPPLPYRMRLRVELVDCDRPHAIDATIGGDLIGIGRLRLRPAAEGTLAEVSWRVEMRQPAMRLASRIGRPVLQWGHDRVVEVTVAGFRQRIESG
ncbi:MAG: SRPBCC family protein [Acidimicrobiales bacterium]|nr:SRPBCC family protein [Acidimicrobiales bacterium]